MIVKEIVTNYNKNIFLKETAVMEGKEVGAMNIVNIYPDITYQEIFGFGGAFTESAGYNVSLLSEDKRREIAEAYFGKDGIHYTLCRTHINSCDFSLGNYAYVKDEKDVNLESFNRDRDRKYIVPFIQLAKEVSEDSIQFLASPWSPPSFMKTNGKMNDGGKLKEEYRLTWAKYIARYIKDCKLDGMDITMLTVQNEPEATQTWDSCIYTAKEEMEFVRDYLGPVLEEEGLSYVKIYVWDHNKEILLERARDILEDVEADKYVEGVAFHWYTGDHFEAVNLVREKYPEKKLLFTEGCVEYSRFMDSNEVNKAEMYAHDIVGNLNAGMNGSMDWNLVLDEKGGPNHVNNFCAAPIMCDVQNNTYEKRLSYYYIGHFSKYILPGAKRMAVTRFSDDIEVTAFLNTNGERVVVVLNKQNQDVNFTLREYGMGVDINIDAHSIVTLLISNQ